MCACMHVGVDRSYRRPRTYVKHSAPLNLSIRADTLTAWTYSLGHTFLSHQQSGKSYLKHLSS